MKVFQEGKGKPIKAWVDGVELEDAAKQQLVNIASMPFIYKHVAVMPDVHWGMGATVGSVIATKGAIIPAAVGVDIGCGMAAVRTTLKANQLPDNLAFIRSEIEKAVPHGRTDNGGPNDRGAWGEIPERVAKVANALTTFNADWKFLMDVYGDELKTKNKSEMRHLGTLGTGNHFIELCVDENQDVWVMLHSGSRGIGNKIGSTFIQLAKDDMERFFINLPDKDLAYIPEQSTRFDDYWLALTWAQNFARENRNLMMESVLQVLRDNIKDFDVTEDAVNCHHNYVSRENHYGANILLTRKGAVSARQGILGIIPGSMGTRSYIVSGLGNPESFCSCSHGAGRRMSRGQARKQISLEEHAKATEGVECRKDAEVLDESPAAYKDIDAVMEAQKDLVEIKHTLKQILCVKG